MEYVQINHIDHPLFPKMHQLLQDVFPAEEVLEYELWREPLQDPQIRMFVAVHEGEVVGATEYRYYDDFNVAMTDFTIVGREGLGIGRFLTQQRQEDLNRLAAANGKELYGMFAEIYDPYRIQEHSFGGVMTMNPFVRREVLSHQGYRKLNFPYVHPSWKNDGEAVSELDLCFLSYAHQGDQLSASIVVEFLKRYYTVLPNKADAWNEMITQLEATENLELLPL